MLKFICANKSGIRSFFLLLTSVSVGCESSYGIGFTVEPFGGNNVLARRSDAHCSSKDQVIVAVIDTGIDLSSPGIAGSLWSDPAAPGVYGWDFSNDSPNPVDEHGHGTQIAQIILRNAPCSKIMPLKYYQSQAWAGAANQVNAVRAIRYAVEQRVDIINFSGGGYGQDPFEFEAIRAAESKGILFIAAAGNDHVNMNLQGFFPASYGLTNIVSVANSQNNLKLARSSNYGNLGVDLAAPGTNVFVPGISGIVTSASGTSASAAYVSGVAAAILREDYALHFKEVKSIMFKSATRRSEFKGLMRFPSIVNLEAAKQKARSFRRRSQGSRVVAVEPLDSHDQGSGSR